MDTAVAIRTLEATYKLSADAAAVETMILRLTEKVWVLYIILNSCCFQVFSLPISPFTWLWEKGVSCCTLAFIYFLLACEIASVGRSSSQEQGNGRQCYTDSSFNLEIIIDHVKGMEILLASSHSFYASCALYWYSFFGLGAFFVFSCGKFLSINCVIFCQLSV